MALDSWLLRGVVPSVPKAGRGAARRFQFVDAVRIAAIAVIERHGLPVGEAGRLLASVDDAFVKAIEGPDQPMVLLLARSAASIIPRIGMIRMWQGLERGLDFPNVHTAVDLTKLAADVRTALERPAVVWRWEGGSGEHVTVLIEDPPADQLPPDQQRKKRRRSGS